jgi:hypothetical protein
VCDKADQCQQVARYFRCTLLVADYLSHMERGISPLSDLHCWNIIVTVSMGPCSPFGGSVTFHTVSTVTEASSEV